MKTHQGIKKRFKKSHPKKRKFKLTRQSKGMGSKHLKTKKSNSRKRRIRQRKSTVIVKTLERAVRNL
jgi:ribosomal protein L35